MKLLEQLIEQEVNRALDEAKSTPGNPNVFWLVTAVGPKVEDKMRDLASGVLKGVSGISDNNRILMHWLGIGRNAVLVMNANSLIKSNDIITKVWYDDEDQLTDNDMALLRRIFNADPAPRGNSRIIQNIWDNTYREMLAGHEDFAKQIGSMMRDGYLPRYEILDGYEKGEQTIDSLRDLARYFKTEIDKFAQKENRPRLLEFSETDWTFWLRRGVLKSVRTYSSEGEWIVEGGALRVPEKSKLLVFVSSPPQNWPEGAQAKVKQGEIPKMGVDFPAEEWTGRHMNESMETAATVYKYGLDKRYDVRFLDFKKWKEIQINLQVKHQYG